MKKIVLMIMLIGAALSARSEDWEPVFQSTETIEIYHTPFSVMTIVALTPETLRQQATWVLLYRDWRALGFKRGLPEKLITYLDRPVEYDCRWSIVFKDSKGMILAELDFAALNGDGEFNGRPCRVDQALIDKMNNLAMGIIPSDNLAQARGNSSSVQ